MKKSVVNQKEDIIMRMQGGNYMLNQPIRITEEYTSKNGFKVKFIAAEGETPIIHGGQKIEGWTQVSGNLYKVSFNSEKKLRTLFINGKRARMAGSKKLINGLGSYGEIIIKGDEPWTFGSGSTIKGIKFPSGSELSPFRNPSDVELVQNNIWAEKILCVQNIEKWGDTIAVELQQPYSAILNSLAWAGKTIYTGNFFLRNAYELLDEPGEFYFDRPGKTLYYFSRGENMTTAEVIAPVSEGLLEITGSSRNNRVENITFQNITFAYDAWNLMEIENSYGFGGIQSLGMAVKYIPDGNWHPTKYNSCDVPHGSIEVRNAQGIRFINNRFVHIGSAVCVNLVNDVVDTEITGNYFNDLLGNSVSVGHPQHYIIGDEGGKYSPLEEGACRKIRITNNYVRNVSLDFRQLEAMLGFFVEDVHYDYNDIQGTPYGAIAVGWWWGNAKIPESEVPRNNTINYNRLGRTHQVLKDGGIIYMLGKQPGSMVEGNYLFNGPRCIYPDDGSSGWTIQNNFVNSLHEHWLHIASDRNYNITVRHNYVKDNNLINNGRGIFIEDTKVFRNIDFSEEAKAIEMAAGIQPPYRMIIPEKEPEAIQIIPQLTSPLKSNNWLFTDFTQQFSSPKLKTETIMIQNSCLKKYINNDLINLLKQDFHPYPAYEDEIWRMIPDSIRKPYIEQAEKVMNDKWESLPASCFMEFKTTGERNSYQEVYFRKRNQLNLLAMGELLEGKGRFITSLIDGLLSTCEETWWGLPAHYRTNLPDIQDQNVDLFAAQTAGDIAFIQYIYFQVLDSISPLLNERITLELKRRILDPCRNRKFGWMRQSHNWNPWITSHWITVALFAEKNMTLKAKDISSALEAMDYYYSHYREDGGCDEGPGYWGSSCGSFFNCNYLLYKATDGKIDMRNEKKFHNMGQFICKIYMGGTNRFVNFADASPRTKINPGLVYEYGKFIDDEMMKSFGALKAREVFDGKGMLGNGKGASMNGFLYTMLSAQEIVRQPTRVPFVRDRLFPELQVFISRTIADSDKGFSFAMKGGHNDENHNHNDVGTYIIYADGEPLLIDLGSFSYNATYFSKKRYTFWGVNSDYHNTPIINGVVQKNGQEYAARSVKAKETNGIGSFTLDIAGAYPVESAVNSWIREVRLYRNKNVIRFSENYLLNEYKAPSSIVLMTAATVEEEKPGILLLTQKEKKFRLSFNPKQLVVQIEEVKHPDATVRTEWNKIYRIKLQIRSQELSGQIIYLLSD
ncbi:MAG: heparinase II/III-family protein [Prevotella sp.]|nr:heparinase II/III-family protein [Prevotella sp.]